MKIEKWCDGCGHFQHTIMFIVGKPRNASITLGASDLKCNMCNSEKIVLKFVPLASVMIGTGSR